MFDFSENFKRIKSIKETVHTVFIMAMVIKSPSLSTQCIWNNIRKVIPTELIGMTGVTNSNWWIWRITVSLNWNPSSLKEVNDTYGFNAYLSERIALIQTLKNLRFKEWVYHKIVFITKHPKWIHVYVLCRVVINNNKISVLASI